LQHGKSASLSRLAGAPPVTRRYNPSSLADTGATGLECMTSQHIPIEGKGCFVVMPFAGLWDEYYTQIHEPGIKAAGLVPLRADEVFRAGSVLQDIVALLSRASVVLADLSENNRNVHYELGLAHALGKPTVLVAPKGVPLFFDVTQERMLTYDKDDPFWGVSLRERITRALSETLRKPETAIPTAFMHIKPARIETDEVVVRLRRIEERLTELASGSQFGARAFQSSLQEKIHGLPAAEVQAERLLATMEPHAAVRQLMIEGYGAAMAESAVATAASRRHERKTS